MITKILKYVLLTCISIPTGIVLGQVFAFCLYALLQKLGLDDDLFRFMDMITIFKHDN